MYDTHAHVVSGDTVGFPPLGSNDPTIAVRLADPFTAEKLLAAMDETEIHHALLVQRGQIYGYDNSYVMVSAAASGGRLRAVCGIDASDPACGTLVRRLHAEGAAGMRLMARMGSTDFDWLDGSCAAAFWQAAADCATPVSVHVFGWNRVEGLARLGAMLDRYPVATLVIDHLTNSPIASAAECGIDDAVRAMSERANVALKFTALPLNDLAERGIDAGRVLGAYLSLYGAERLLWGSDVTQSQGTYAELAARGRAAVAAFAGPVASRLLGGNAARIYGG